ncbi:MAG TPA: HepT-like ribonuclease domain-containing protein [Terriglobales bacterium]|nr:HepT-like ribonuclease domain-containing protein [Terriglobales bacterium]
MKSDRLYLQHIRDALKDIASYTNAGRESFLADGMQQDATLRKLEVIGQAVKNLSETAISSQPEIPWKRIAGMRDKIIHDYFWRQSGHHLGGCRK